MRHHAGENLYRVRLLALGGEARLAGAAAIEIALDLFSRQRDQRRAAVDHAADRNPVAFAEGRDPEHVAEGVEGHFLGSEPSIAVCGSAGGRAGQIWPCLNYIWLSARR